MPLTLLIRRRRDLSEEPGQDVAEAVTQLIRIGLDDVRGAAGDLGDMATARFEPVDLVGFLHRLAGPGAQVLDVRMPSEHRHRPLPGAIERFVPDLVTEGILAELDQRRPVLVACGTGRGHDCQSVLICR